MIQQVAELMHDSQPGQVLEYVGNEQVDPDG